MDRQYVGIDLHRRRSVLVRTDRAGNKLAWEESAQIASKFDPASGRWGLYNGDRPVFEVDVQSGEIRVGGRRVRVEFEYSG